MNDSEKGNKQPQVVGIRREIFRILDQEYEESKPKLPTFTAFVNQRLENKIKRDRLLTELYPDLRVLTTSSDSIYVQDETKDVIVQVEINKQKPFNSKCRQDKMNSCEHVKYALLSPALLDLYEDISGSSDGSTYGEDDAIRKLVGSRKHLV